MSELARSLDRYEVENGNSPEVVAARLMCRPHVLFRPVLSMDGNKWCALYGENLQEGIAGFGDTPHQACIDFDKHWKSDKVHAPSRIEP